MEDFLPTFSLPLLLHDIGAESLCLEEISFESEDYDFTNFETVSTIMRWGFFVFVFLIKAKEKIGNHTEMSFRKLLIQLLMGI